MSYPYEPRYDRRRDRRDDYYRYREPSPGVDIHIHNVQDNLQDSRSRPAYAYPEAPIAPPPGAWPIAVSPPVMALSPVLDGRRRSWSRGRRYSEEDDRRAAIEQYKYEQAEEERRRKAAIEEFELKRKKSEEEKKEAEAAAVEKWKEEQRKKEAKEKEAWEAYELKRREKEQKEKDEKKKQDAVVKERLEKALGRLDLDDKVIEKLVDGKKVESRELVHHGHGHKSPVWSRVRRSEISTETLKFYDIPYYRDPNDHDYLVIKQELSQREIDMLYEHTRRHHKHHRDQPLIEDRKKDGLVIVRDRSRKRSKSRDRSRGRDDTNAEKFARGLMRFVG